MRYIVVTGYNKEANTCHVVAVDATTYTVKSDFGYVNAEQLAKAVLDNSASMTPLNFSVSAPGKLVQDCGDFSRFSLRGSAVVLAEVRNKSKRRKGYLLLSCANNAVVQLKTEDIVQRENALPGGEHFLQNGIVRGNVVSCFPGKSFPVFIETTIARPAVPTPRPLKVAEPAECTEEKSVAYDPVRVLSGMSGPPDAGLSQECLDELVKQMITLVHKRIELDGEITEKMKKHIGKMLTWVMEIPEMPKALRAIYQLRDGIPDVMSLLFDETFCKKYCPVSEAFFDKNAEMMFGKHD